jgi:hypothetical protein
MKKQRGVMTLDFIFSLILVVAVTVAFFAVSATLAVVESAQYITFATGRAFFAAQNTQEEQLKAGVQKFDSLRKVRPFRGLFDDSWFGLSLTNRESALGQNLWDRSREYDGNADDREGSLFKGPVVEFYAPILSFNVPSLGSTGAEDSFRARLTAFLGREPNSDECRSFIDAKWEKLKSILGSQYDPLTRGAFVEQSSVVMIEDNGC